MAADPSATDSNFVTAYRTEINTLLDSRESLKGFRELAATRGYPGTLSAGAFAGNNADLVAADIAAVISAMDALEMVLTDFTKTPPEPTAALAALLKLRH